MNNRKNPPTYGWRTMLGCRLVLGLAVGTAYLPCYYFMPELSVFAPIVALWVAMAWIVVMVVSSERLVGVTNRLYVDRTTGQRICWPGRRTYLKAKDYERLSRDGFFLEIGPVHLRQRVRINPITPNPKVRELNLSVLLGGRLTAPGAEAVGELCHNLGLDSLEKLVEYQLYEFCELYSVQLGERLYNPADPRQHKWLRENLERFLDGFFHNTGLEVFEVRF